MDDELQIALESARVATDAYNALTEEDDEETWLRVSAEMFDAQERYEGLAGV